MAQSRAERSVWYVVGAGALVAIGTLLSWVKFFTILGGLSIDGTDTGDGKTVLITAAVAVAAASVAVIRGWHRRILSAISVLACLVILYIGIYDSQNVERHVVHASKSDGIISAHVGIGLWFVDIAGAALLVAVVRALLTPRLTASATDSLTGVYLASARPATDAAHQASVTAAIPTQKITSEVDQPARTESM